MIPGLTVPPISTFGIQNEHDNSVLTATTTTTTTTSKRLVGWQGSQFWHKLSAIGLAVPPPKGFTLQNKEHGGCLRSVHFFSNEADLDYVSCSPFRVPIARLAAAQATVAKA